MVGAVSGRAWALYALMAVLWGIPYLFIKEAADPAAALTAIGEVLLVALLYATAPFIIATKLTHVPSLGTITLSLWRSASPTCRSRC